MILTNVKSKELTGMEELIFVPAVIDITDVVHFRQSVDDDGNLEPYSYIYTETIGSMCIDIPFSEFKEIFLNKNQ